MTTFHYDYDYANDDTDCNKPLATTTAMTTSCTTHTAIATKTSHDCDYE